MGSGSESEDQFFDSRDEITSVSNCFTDCSEDCSTSAVPCVLHGNVGYDFLTGDLKSVEERRNRFFSWMGLGSDRHESCGEDDVEMENEIEKEKESNGTYRQPNSNSENQCLPSRSIMSCRSNESKGSAEYGALEVSSTGRIRYFKIGREFIIDELTQRSMLNRLREMGSGVLDKVKDFYRALSSSSLAQQLRWKEAEMWHFVDMNKKAKNSLLQTLGFLYGIANRMKGLGCKPCNRNSKLGLGIRRVRVRPYRKRFKELSALYPGQEFCAHEGSILTMKFSPDGNHLASGGKDGIVRVWKVTQGDRQCSFITSDTDSSCVSPSSSQSSFPSSLDANLDKTDKTLGMGRSQEPTLVIFPPKVFQILENPMHEFQGHNGEVLSLSWSQKGDLLSSSVDKTVRLWRVGESQCVKVFPHNNYVTCVEFNPINENNFISGSIDGKVRIWEVCSCRVVDWIDIREIVTAVCYCPNGKGGIVGTIKGSCHFYDIKDDLLQLSAKITLCEKKKFSQKRITGFQYFPRDLNKVMVTSADSQIQILFGTNVICKFKGKQIPGNRAAATFTSDGKHIISAARDSTVYVWNCSSPVRKSSKAKKIRSCERFIAKNGSIAIPWGGMKTAGEGSESQPFTGDSVLESTLENMTSEDSLVSGLGAPFWCPGSLLSKGFLLEVLHRGSATWPEEKLPVANPMGALHLLRKSYNPKFLKNACQNTLGMWGLVIVTAGLDGWIRTYLNYGLPIRF